MSKKTFRQSLIYNFTEKKTENSEPKLKRNYEELVQGLLEKARELLKDKMVKDSNDVETNDSLKKENKSSKKKVIKKKYYKYTKQEKEAILALLPHKALVEIEKEFGIPESTIRSWRGKENLEDKRTNNGRKPVLEELEQGLLKELESMRNDGVPINGKTILAKIQGLYMTHNKLDTKSFSFLQRWAKYAIDKGLEMNSILMKPFTDKWECLNENEQIYELTQEEKVQLRDLLLQINSNLVILDLNWVHRYAARVGLSYRRITHKSTKVSGNLEEDILSFIEEIHQIRKDCKIPVEFIVNVDETAVYFDQLPMYSYDFKGAQHPTLKVSNMYKKRITACLGISAAGEKLNSMLIFKGKGLKVRKLNNKESYLIYKNENAWMTLQIFKDYLKFSCKKFLNRKRNEIGNPNQLGLIILDNFSGHVFDVEELNKLETELECKIKYLPPNCTAHLQPLDLSTNYLLKSKLRNLWIDWYVKQYSDKKEHENFNCPCPSKQNVYEWFTQAYNSIPPLTIIKSFLCTGLSNDLNGHEDILSKYLSKKSKPEENIVNFIESNFPKAIPESENKFYQDVYEDNKQEVIHKEDLDG